MAFTATVSGRHNLGALKLVYGTFTSADGDNTFTLNSATHGLNLITAWGVALDELGSQAPHVSKSSGTVTAIWSDTRGNSGSWFVIGR